LEGIGTSQRREAADIQPQITSPLCYYTGVLLHQTVISVQDDRNQRITSKQWDNIDQQEANVISGMIAMAAATTLVEKRQL